ncbi:MAG: TIGR03905 family TSCPD domain-containing protein [Erysipelotrichaceae bacterium]|nr:TIGR03905 family TSCPD domain-containing protein [Erysipelotrichaceae bacterium]
MKRMEYQTEGVCSSKIIIEVDNHIIQSVQFIGGCPGNTIGVSKLCQGKNIDDVIQLLTGIDCRGRGTSCPDQLAKALIQMKEKSSQEGNVYVN